MSFEKTFQALSDPTRRKILTDLKSGPKTAGELAAQFELTAATVSHHLSVLRESGLIWSEKQGKYVRYELNTSVVDELLGWVLSLKKEEMP